MTFELNPEQARAASQLRGSVLITAGAGSGKTRMLTERFANAVVGGRVAGWDAADPQSVVAITFTEKAAGEISERVRAEIGGAGPTSVGGRGDLWISTIHGFCTRILRRYPFEAGIDPQFSVADSLRAGRLGERAFRNSLAELDAEALGIRDLLGAYSEDRVYEAVREVARHIVVVDRGEDAVELETPLPLDELVDHVALLFTDGLSVCDIEYHGKSTSLLDHSETCRTLLDELRVIETSRLTDSERIERIQGLVERYEPINRLADLVELREEMRERKENLRSLIATASTAPHARALARLARTYAREYASIKQAAGLLDFEDLQTKTVRLLEGRPEVAAHYRERFAAVMIDEFQDTDALQLRLIEKVAGENLCTVGDEMQSIYGFRGADVDVYREHRREMERRGALQVELAVNYRSHPQILDFVNAVFESSEYRRNRALSLRPAPQPRPEQPIDRALGCGPRVEVSFVDSGTGGIQAGRAEEAAALAQRLAELIEGGVGPGDVAILLRAYTEAHVYADALTRRGIPAVVVGGSRFFGLAEIAVMRALTRVIANVADEAALGTLLVSEFASVSDDALFRLRLNDSAAGRLSLWDLICGTRDSLGTADSLALDRLRWVIESAHARLAIEPLADVLLRAVEEAGYDVRLLHQGNMGRDAFANVLKFVRRAAEFESSEGLGPAGFAEHLDDKERLRDLEAPETASDGASSAVRIMSIHAAKGLEFPVVAVPDIGRQSPVNGSIVRTKTSGDAIRMALKAPRREDENKRQAEPSWFSAIDNENKQAEEQGSERLFYVALTRARDMLLISGAGALNPRTRPESKTDLVKLARVVQRDVPIGEPGDENVELAGGAVCRVRVVSVAGTRSAEPRAIAVTDEIPPLPIGEPLGDDEDDGSPPRTVSYTQLSEFASCPRRFQVRRILGIAPPPPALVAQDPKRFGNALHAVLRLVSPEGALPSAERIGAVARYFEMTAEEKDRLIQAARCYSDSDVAQRVSEAEGVLHEAPLVLSLGCGAFYVAGSIDVYAKTGDRALIVDYKSGVSGNPDLLADRYRLQATCYALAALRDGAQHVEVVFARPEVTRDGEMERVRYEYFASDASAIEADLECRYREIEQSAFGPTPGEACATCQVPQGLCGHRVMRRGSSAG